AGALIDHFPHSGRQGLEPVREISADHDEGGVEQIHRSREDFSKAASRVAQQPDRLRISGTGELGYPTRVGDLPSRGREPAYQRPATRHGLEAAHVTAPADLVSGVGPLR